MADCANGTTQRHLDAPLSLEMYTSKSFEGVSSFSSKSLAAQTPTLSSFAADSPTDHGISKSQTFVWDIKSGKQVIEHVRKRPRTNEENRHRRFVRENGGACDECRKNHRKVCLPSLARGTQEMLAETSELQCDHPQHVQGMTGKLPCLPFHILRSVKHLSSGARLIPCYQRRKREAKLKIA